MFPEKYFGTREIINKVLRRAEEHPELMSLEVGGNTTCRCKYNLDPNMEGENVIDYDNLSSMKFDIIVARNSINYLSIRELNMVLSTLKDGGIFIANGFANPPDISIRPEHHEVAVKYNDKNNIAVIDHFLMVDDQIYTHSFYGRGADAYKKMGFTVISNGRSIIINKGNVPK